jgi:hypothetical protein
LMPELTPEQDSTGGEKQKKNVYVVIIMFSMLTDRV